MRVTRIKVSKYLFKISYGIFATATFTCKRESRSVNAQNRGIFDSRLAHCRQWAALITNNSRRKHRGRKREATSVNTRSLGIGIVITENRLRSMLFKEKKKKKKKKRKKEKKSIRVEASRIAYLASRQRNAESSTIISPARDGCGASHLVAERSQTANAGTNEVQRAPTRAIRFLRFQSSLTHFHPFGRPPACLCLPALPPSESMRSRKLHAQYPPLLSVQGAPNVTRISLTRSRSGLGGSVSLSSVAPNRISNSCFRV
jgi:hypothetical protein